MDWIIQLDGTYNKKLHKYLFKKCSPIDVLPIDYFSDNYGQIILEIIIRQLEMGHAGRKSEAYLVNKKLSKILKLHNRILILPYCDLNLSYSEKLILSFPSLEIIILTPKFEYLSKSDQSNKIVISPTMHKDDKKSQTALKDILSLLEKIIHKKIHSIKIILSEYFGDGFNWSVLNQNIELLDFHKLDYINPYNHYELNYSQKPIKITKQLNLIPMEYFHRYAYFHNRGIRGEMVRCDDLEKRFEFFFQKLEKITEKLYSGGGFRPIWKIDVNIDSLLLYLIDPIRS